MTLGIMQPYVFPYIGYFQLINAVDKFVILDDVNYINKGWINRNRILVNDAPYLFTIPLKNASQNTAIKDIQVLNDLKWKTKFLKTIELNYSGARSFLSIFPLIEEIFMVKNASISELAFLSISRLLSLLNIDTILVPTSTQYRCDEFKGQERVLEICQQEDARTYINPIGGGTLYNAVDFASRNIGLLLLETDKSKFPDIGLSELSIIHVLMHSSVEEVKTLLQYVTLKKAY